VREKETLNQYLAERILRDKAMQGKLQEYLEELQKEELVSLLMERIVPADIHLIPLSIFSVTELSSLELVVKFLKENERMKNREIAETIGRTQQVVWTTYHNARKKYPLPLPVMREADDFPASVILKGPALESIVVFLCEKRKLSYAEAARRLHRDERTIWTTYKRSTKRP